MSALPKELNPVWLAHSRFRRRRFDECIDICTKVLERNPYDQAVWYLKCRSLTLKNWINDTEIEEEGIADALLDENQVAQVARPGTSLGRPATGAQGGPNQSVRPMTGAGRPLTGFARPGTSTRSNTSGGTARQGTADLNAALRGNGATRPGTSLNRPVTSSGRFVRLGTASMLSEPGGPFINSEQVDLRKYASRPHLARSLCDYMLYVDHNVKRALELCAMATQKADFQDWWWKARLGKCYYQLGLLRDAEKQLKSSIKTQEMMSAVLELAKVYLRLDQPNSALEHYTAALQAHPGDPDLLLGMARVYDALGDTDKGVQFYKNVLYYDASNVEAIACLAAFHFYTDQPEIALRYYRRLLQMGVTNTELWTNLGLCCFYASQYDLCLGCFERALQLSDDGNVADVWYNISQVAVGIGDLGLAGQCLRLAVALDPGHAEAHTNLGVLEGRKGNDTLARSHFMSAQASGHAFEPFFNGGLLAFKTGDFQESFTLVSQALAAYPEHSDSLELMKQLKAQLTML
ncbi:TRP protein for flagellar function [Haematococcus lacustris]